MVSKLDLQTYTSEFEFHWVPLSYGLVPHLSKKLSKLPLPFFYNDRFDTDFPPPKIDMQLNKEIETKSTGNIFLIRNQP